VTTPQDFNAIQRLERRAAAGGFTVNTRLSGEGQVFTLSPMTSRFPEYVEDARVAQFATVEECLAWLFGWNSREFYEGQRRTVPKGTAPKLHVVGGRAVKSTKRK